MSHDTEPPVFPDPYVRTPTRRPPMNPTAFGRAIERIEGLEAERDALKEQVLELKSDLRAANALLAGKGFGPDGKPIRLAKGVAR